MELIIKNLTKKFGDITAVDQLNIQMTNGVYGSVSYTHLDVYKRQVWNSAQRTNLL